MRIANKGRGNPQLLDVGSPHLENEMWATQIGEESDGADGLEEEPGAPFGFVDPVFEQAGGGHVVVVGGDFVGVAHVFDELEVVVMQLGEH